MLSVWMQTTGAVLVVVKRCRTPLTSCPRPPGPRVPARTPNGDCRSPGREGSQLVQPGTVPGGAQLFGVVPVTDVAARVTVSSVLKMPPPSAAVLPVTWLGFKVSAPPGSGIGAGRGMPLAMPPPSPPAWLLFTVLLLMVRVVGTV